MKQHLKCEDSDSIGATKVSNAAYTCFHLCPCRYVCGMHDHFGWLEVGGGYLFFDPEDNVITCPAGIVTQVMIEAQMGDSTSLQ